MASSTPQFTRASSSSTAIPPRMRQSSGTPSAPSPAMQHASRPPMSSQGFASHPRPNPIPSSWGLNPPGPLKFFAEPPLQRRQGRGNDVGYPLSQSLFTTYESRIKTGVTLLVQPKEITGAPKEGHFHVTGSGGDGGSATPTGWEVNRFGRQTRKRVNYAEDGKDDDLDEDEDDNRRRKPAAGAMEKAKEDQQENWSWLGERPPGERLRSKHMNPETSVYPPDFEEDIIDFSSIKPSYLVPIRIEFETEKHRIRDCFMWNVNENLITPEYFATQLCLDLGISPDSYSSMISEEIRRQVLDSQELAIMDIENGHEDPSGLPAKRLREDFELVSDDEEDEAQRERKRERRAKMTKRQVKEREADLDCRVMVNLELQISNCTLRDRFEWDLGSTLTPEAFTESYCADLGLTGEAKPLISHAIHEEILRHKREAWDRGFLKTGSGCYEQTYGPKKLRGIWREYPDCEEFAPSLHHMTVEEIEKKEREDGGRNARRTRREMARYETGRSSRRY